MKKKIIVCSTTSEQEIINAAKEYFGSEGFEYQDVITENGEVGVQARKTGLIRKCTGTSYALQVMVKKCDNNKYEITAGWGEWLSKGAVVMVATFVAFGILIIPAMFGIMSQCSLPSECLDSITNRVSCQNPICKVYELSKA